MRDGILSEIRAEYEVLKADNQRIEAQRRAEAAQKDPQIAELDALRTQKLLSSIRAAIGRTENATEMAKQLPDEVRAINEQIRKRLVQSGFPADYLEPIYTCPTCRDEGYVGDTLRERCECFERRLREHLYQDAGHGLNPAESFAAFNEMIYPEAPLEHAGGTQREYMLRMRDRCLAYAEGYPNAHPKNLLFIGMSGLGKTYLMNCIGNHLLARGHEVRKITAYELSERMRASIFGGEREAFSRLLSLPMLMLDDLGAEPLINNITVECLFTLLNERELHGLHTIISTNLATLELQKRYTERIYSRLVSKKTTAVLPFFGKDVRMLSL